MSPIASATASPAVLELAPVNLTDVQKSETAEPESVVIKIETPGDSNPAQASTSAIPSQTFKNIYLAGSNFNDLNSANFKQRTIEVPVQDLQRTGNKITATTSVLLKHPSKDIITRKCTRTTIVVAVLYGAACMVGMLWKQIFMGESFYSK